MSAGHIAPDPGCELCREVDSGGSHASTGNGRPFGSARLIMREAGVDAIAGLGALTSGYVVVMPMNHVLSVGQLDASGIEAVARMTARLRVLTARAFGGCIVIIEHGSSAREATPARACIDHAHVHLFRVPLESDVSGFALEGSELVSDYASALRQLRGEDYYYYRLPDGTQRVKRLVGRLESQFPRRVWAGVLGRESEWDWGVVPGFDDALRTTRRLRALDAELRSAWSALECNGALAETVRAYDIGSDWYAERTNRFPAGSSLTAELERFEAATQGVLLDAGAGGGRDSRLLASMGRATIALDAAPNLLATIPDMPGLVKLQGDVRMLPIPDASIGGVWCSAVLLHLHRADVAMALAEFRRVLAIGGLLQVSTKDVPEGQLMRIPGTEGLRRTTFPLPPDELRTLVADAGFAIEATWHEDETDGRETRWHKVLARAS